MKGSGLKILAATEKTDKLYTTYDYTVPVALILGSEEDGISPEYLEMADEKVSIPLAGEISSLNVSVAAGVILYEAVRQRKLVK
jgi:23S rRNA (guanosine2251-2'-O)-methyltransferase